jgi:hypothetical protein
MKFKNTVISFFILFVFYTNGHLVAQSVTIKEFSKDSVLFFEEVSTMLSNVKKKEAKEFMEEFALFWYGGKFSEAQRNSIYKTCNLMLDKKLHPYPEFHSYLFSLMSFVKSNQSIQSFNAWQRSFEKIIEGKNKKKVTEYLEFSSELFAQNAIYVSPSVKWKSSSANYVFEIEDEIPKIIFSDLHLICVSKGDSSVIINTKGYYYPTLNKWYGTGGKITWERAGFNKDEVYATFDNYIINTKSSGFEIDSVTFYNPKFFSKPLLGKLEEKLLANVSEEKSSYPRFDSYSKRLQINNIAEKVNYEGGYAQHGIKFIGNGDDNEPAKLIFLYEEKPLLVASSKSFTIRPDRFTSAHASVSIFLDKDSISHPGLRFNFNIHERMLNLIRSDEGVSKSPYFNSFHAMDMYFEALYWHVDKPFIEMKALEGSSDHSAKFESSNYFRESLFDRMQGIDKMHPLTALRMCARQSQSDELWLKEVAQFMQLPITQVKPLLLRLAFDGFIFYDLDNDKIVLKDRLHHFVESKAKKADYDVILFNSNTDKETNATLNLLNYDLTIRGVKQVFLSDTQKVFIYPKERTVVVKKDLDMFFSGIVSAGKMEFYGKDYYFNYNNFKIDMPIVDSLRIWANTNKKDDAGNKLERRVLTVLEYLKGELTIDMPKNKSGNQKAPQYPIFDSHKDAFAFYQKSSIQGNAYNKDKFHFHLEPFVFDSLKSFENKSIQFKGTFVSSGIFPEFKETLRLMPDYSLGFERNTPPEGMDVYGGKGKFLDKIILSHNGLMGNGRLKYLTSTSTSNALLFFPDSARGVAQNFVIEERSTGVEFPPTNANDVFVSWKPFQDVLQTNVMTKPIQMYDGSKLFGSTFLRPKGLTGRGLFKFEDAELESKLYKFSFIEFRADTADFKLKTMDASALAFSTKNVNAFVSFKERKGEFISNGGGSFIDFPVNQYMCFMDKFTWFMDEESIELGASKNDNADQGAADVKLEGSKFISTHPDQDSLQFYSARAKYDLKKNIIYASEVVYINVADALIYPDSGKTVIEKRAKMRTLNNAKIIANNVTKYHTIYDATVDIKARKKYNASGKYDYKDELKRVKTFEFNNIKVDSTFQTFASGEIKKDEDFTLSPNFNYYGGVELRATKRSLVFTGYATILHNCEQIPRYSFHFSSEIDPNNIYIPIDTLLMDKDKNRLNVGPVMSKDSASIYSTFISQKNNNKDLPIISANGYLFYDKKSGEYRISNLAKLNEMNLTGNYVSLNTRECKSYAEGKLDFAADLGHITTKTVGNFNHVFVNDSVYFDVLMLIDFFFLESLIDDIGKNIADNIVNEPVNIDRKVYEKGLRELLGKEEADKLISQMVLNGSFRRMPDELNGVFFFNDIKMRWNKETNSYQSVGDKIGIGNTYKRQINKYVTGYVEIEKSKSGDVLSIYIETSKDNWYHFKYKKFVMQAYSSDSKFNNAIKDAKPDKRKVKTTKGEAPFQFMLGTERNKNEMLRKFQNKE